MWLVDLALRRPYTYIVMALMILLATPFALRSTPTDILPEIRIPVISIVWQYSGLPPIEMGNRFAGVTERALTTTVNDIEHIESQSMAGVAVVKLFFQPNANIQTALAQVVAIKSVLGPQEIKGERGLLVGYVTMNTRDRDEVSVVEDLRNYAIARIYLDNFAHIKAYWAMIGRNTAQLSLNFGTDALDGTPGSEIKHRGCHAGTERPNDEDADGG